MGRQGDGVELMVCDGFSPFGLEIFSLLVLVFSDKISLILNDLESVDPKELLDEDMLVILVVLLNCTDEAVIGPEVF